MGVFLFESNTMARLNVIEVMKQVASTVNQSATAPTVNSDEYDLWLQYLNRSQAEWARAFDWESLRIHYFPTITGASTATIALPIYFKKIAAPIQLFDSGFASPLQFSYVIDEDEAIYDPNDRFFTLTGDISSGKSVVLNPATLVSGASLEIQFFATPSTLSGASQYLAMEDPQFAVDRTIAYIFESRSDPRFQVEETKARERLLSMVEDGNDEKFNSYASTSYIATTLARNSFRLGRD